MPGHRKPSLHLDLGVVAGAPGEELPPLAALFLIHFDTKKGYTIQWQRTADEVDLEGVEFKSLPSGLHNLNEDLVYFVHGSYAGISAFVNIAAAMEERGALMVSVGVLVPLSYGRLGRSWRHAEGLKRLARQFTTDTSTYKPFEDYYELYKLRGAADSTDSLLVDTPDLVSKRRFSHQIRSRSVSEPGTHLVPGQSLSQSHPALSLGEFMGTFGPLVFPIYRAALSRKRILLVTRPPVETACNFVYDISILSNIPLSTTNLLPTEPSRLKPLFNIGVHDITMLETEARIRAETANSPECERGAWVACTTDEVLGMKNKLWDIIIHLPPSHAKQAKETIWPTAETSKGIPVKATQRDLRRFRALTRSLKMRYRRKKSLFLDAEDDDEGQPIIRAPNDADPVDEELGEPNNIEEVCERLTWREIAYSSFIWWASAGEQQRSDAESEDGRLLLDTHFSYTPTFPDYYHTDHNSSSESDGERHSVQQDSIAPHASSSSSSPAIATRRHSRPRRLSVIRRRSTNLRQEGLGSEEMDLIAYFHRMTQRLFSVLAEDVAAAEGAAGVEEELENDDIPLFNGGETGRTVCVSLDNIERMGLDRYSEGDRDSVAELVERWWGKEVDIERGRVRCCGVECG